LPAGRSQDKRTDAGRFKHAIDGDLPQDRFRSDCQYPKSTGKSLKPHRDRNVARAIRKFGALRGPRFVKTMLQGQGFKIPLLEEIVHPGTHHLWARNNGSARSDTLNQAYASPNMTGFRSRFPFP
jgi:hypothetical protein